MNTTPACDNIRRLFILSYNACLGYYALSFIDERRAAITVFFTRDLLAIRYRCYHDLICGLFRCRRLITPLSVDAMLYGAAPII